MSCNTYKAEELLFLFLQVFFFPAVVYLLIVLPPLFVLLFTIINRIGQTERVYWNIRLKVIVRFCFIMGLILYFVVSLTMTAIFLRLDNIEVTTVRGVVS